MQGCGAELELDLLEDWVELGSCTALCGVDAQDGGGPCDSGHGRLDGVIWGNVGGQSGDELAGVAGGPGGHTELL